MHITNSYHISHMRTPNRVSRFNTSTITYKAPGKTPTTFPFTAGYTAIRFRGEGRFAPADAGSLAPSLTASAGIFSAIDPRRVSFP